MNKSDYIIPIFEGKKHFFAIFCVLIFHTIYLTHAQGILGVFTQISNAPFGFDKLDIKDMLKDRDGFVWLATNKGLYRYDGHDMRIFQENPLDPNGIGGNLIRRLVEGPDGSVWVGTHEAGLYRFDKYKETFTHYRADNISGNGFSSNYIQDLLFDHEGNLWVATISGLGIVDEELEVIMPFKQKGKNTTDLGTYNINAIVEDDYHHIWIGTHGAGLLRLDPSTGEILSLNVDNQNGKSDDFYYVFAMEKDEKDQLWFSTKGPSLYGVDLLSLEVNKENRISQVIERNAALDVVAIESDRKGNIWLGLNFGGLLCYSPLTSKIERFEYDPANRNSMASNFVQSLMMDNEGMLWIGHSGDGLSQLSTFEQFDQILTQSITQGSQCLMEDSKGYWWIATRERGIYIYDPESQNVQNLQHQSGNLQSLNNNMVWDLVEDKQGNIWIATHSGLQKYNPESQSFTSYGRNAGLQSIPIKSLQIDHTGKLWIGGFDGLYCLDMESEEMHIAYPEIGEFNHVIWDIFEDSHDHLWVAPFGEGLFRLDLESGVWTSFRQIPGDLTSLSNNAVQSIAEDEQGRIWLATKGGGLNLFIPDETDPAQSKFRHWRRYNSDLSEDIIYVIVPDKLGRLWLSTNAGLFSFQAETERFRPQFIAPNIKGLVMKSRTKGRKIFVGNNSIYCFDPTGIKQNKRIPPVFITELHIHGEAVRPGNQSDGKKTLLSLPQSILYTSEIELAYQENDLTFVFASLSYILPEHNLYRYKLELKGKEEDWIEVDASSRQARYTNLRPGRYTFQVQAANHVGIWNLDGRSFSVVIHPPWWLSWWAYLAYVFLILLALAGIRKYELKRYKIREEAKRLKELDKVKSRLYTHITHEFRTPLTIILGMADELENHTNEKGKEGLNMIHRNGEQLLKLVNHMLDLAKLESGSLKLNWEQGEIVNYLRYLVEAFHSYAARKQINIHFLSEEKELYMDYDPDRLMHIISNLLSNAIKFSPAERNIYVTLRKDDSFSQESSFVRLSVKDKGKGIPKEKIPFIFDRFYQVEDGINRDGEGTGIGLTLSRELVELMGGGNSGKQ